MNSFRIQLRQGFTQIAYEFNVAWTNFRVLMFFLIFLFAVMLVSFLFLLQSVTVRAIPPEPPFRYASNSFLPLKAVLCRGEALEFFLESEVTGAPYMSLTARGIYQEITPKNWERIITLPFEVVPVTENQKMSVFPRLVQETRALPQGQYQFRQVSQTLFSDLDYFVVNFTIKNCP